MLLYIYWIPAYFFYDTLYIVESTIIQSLKEDIKVVIEGCLDPLVASTSSGRIVMQHGMGKH
jgi:hypothetical protein